MELLANELSVHEQFHEAEAFREARRYQVELHSSRNFVNVSPMPGVPMQQAVQLFRESQRRAVMNWLTSSGPFWDDARRHAGDDFIECLGNVVTDTAIGEAAYRSFHGVECGLVSFFPSDWNFPP